MVAGLVPVQNSHSGQGSSQLNIKPKFFSFGVLEICWRDDVLVLYCSDKFLRLSLQLLSRYSNWLSAGLAARKAGNAGSNPRFEWAISAVPDDLVCIINDLNGLAVEVCGDYLGHVLELLNSCSTEVLDLVKQSILQGGKLLKDLVPLVMNSIIETLVQKSVEAFLDGDRAATYLTVKSGMNSYEMLPLRSLVVNMYWQPTSLVWLGKQSLHCREYDRVHKDELEQAQMSKTNALK